MKFSFNFPLWLLTIHLGIILLLSSILVALTFSKACLLSLFLGVTVIQFWYLEKTLIVSFFFAISSSNFFIFQSGHTSNHSGASFETFVLELASGVSNSVLGNIDLTKTNLFSFNNFDCLSPVSFGFSHFDIWGLFWFNIFDFWFTKSFLDKFWPGLIVE